MPHSEANFLTVEQQLQLLEVAIADTVFVVGQLLKYLDTSLHVGDQCREMQAAEHQLRTLLHQIRTGVPQKIVAEAQVREGQRLYRQLLHEFETAACDFAASLPPVEQTAVQAHLDVLRSFRDDFPALN